MKTSQLKQLGIVLAVLAVLVLAKELQKPRELAQEEYAPLALSVDTSKVREIQLLRPAGQDEEEYVELVKSEGRWVLQSLLNARTDEKKIEEFLQVLQKPKGEVRGTDSKLFTDFGIADDEAYQVILKDDQQKPLLDLRIGLKKSGVRGSFIRKSGESLVYVTSADFFGKMGIYGDPKSEKLDNNFWASTEIVSLTADQVTGLQITRGQGKNAAVSAHLVKTQDPQDSAKTIWKFARTDLPFALDAAKVSSYIDSFKAWRAQKVTDPAEKDFGFARSDWNLAFTLEGGKTVTITAGDTDDASKSTALQVTGEPVLFLMSPYYYENMDVDDSRFFVDNPLKIDAAQVARLTVQANKQKWTVQPKEKTWEELTKYIEDIKTLYVSRLLLDGQEIRKAKSPSKFFIEILKEGDAQPATLDFGEVVKDAPKEYAVKVRGTAQPFAVAEYVFKKLFEETSRLEPPQPS